MLDLNAIVSAAINAAIKEATEPLVTRIAALESANDILHRVQGDRIAALETKLSEANLFTQMMPATITADAFVTHLDQQEWFWEKLQNRIDATIESAIDTHCETYDHDSYDEATSKVDDLPDLDDYATKDELRSEIEDVLNNATLSLSL